MLIDSTRRRSRSKWMFRKNGFSINDIHGFERFAGLTGREKERV
jgi:hypothetical protein